MAYSGEELVGEVPGERCSSFEIKENDMGSLIKAVRSNMLAQAVLSIALGLLLIFWPGITAITIVYLLALYFAVSGAASLFAYFRTGGARSGSAGVLVNGILLLILALIVFMFPAAVASFFSLVLGILLLIGGLVNVVRSIELRGYASGTWIPALVASILVVLGGVVIVMNPFGTTMAFMIVLGVLLIVKGVFDLLMERWLASAEKALR